MELKEFEIRLVYRVPEMLEFGILYVCFECNVIVHLCACGCGEKVVLPIDPDFWSVKYDGEHISLFPSIGNFQFDCKSHYWIKDNKVVWVPEPMMKMEQKTSKSKIKLLGRIVRTISRWFD